MRLLVLRVALFAPAFVALGCATVPERSYVDDLGDAGALTGDASGTGDVTVATRDAQGDDATTEDAPADDAASDAGPTAPDGSLTDGTTDNEAGEDGGFDAAQEAATDAAVDAPLEAGCGPLTSPQNCGACGVTCDTAHSVNASCSSGTACTYSACQMDYADCDLGANAKDLNGCETLATSTSHCGGCAPCASASASTASVSCTGTTCEYTCKQGFGDCNSLTPPDLDGCETSLTTATNCGSCGNACGGTAACVAHDNGVGQKYYDCYALLTSATPSATGKELALEACTAYTGSRALCAGFTCGSGANGPLVCGQISPSQADVCWSYHGNNLGYVDVDPTGVGYCPSPTIDSTWN